ncbi:LURP-one-related family protein [Halosimplex litoreum]|uniref:LURP-one-related family protein n=1 Tax=Halosimplex litoreum TaxID=1198301 RepID=A0A7T3G0Q1_9EURY|nr:LURP-one-related family protein [Halosimplex litoreum]QPV64136.1 LURP-one-related family protein [Halosimplex litoreum]
MPPDRGVGSGGQTATPTRYRMRERLLAIGDDFVIETAAGQPAFRVDGKALRVRDTIQIRDREGTPLYRVQERMLRFRETMVIERDGQRVATIHKALVTPLRDRFDVQVEGGPPLSVQGNVFDHEYAITRDGLRIATVSKRYFRVRDTYGVEVVPGEDDAFVLAVVAAIDELRESEQGDRRRVGR